MKRRFRFALAFTLLTSSAHADSERTWYSNSWLFHSACDGNDMVYTWKIDGLPTWHIVPWLPRPVAIRAIELTKISGGPTLWFMAGNNIIGDTMIFLGPGENHGRHDFPAGMKMPMPAAAPDAEGQKRYLDLHGACDGTLRPNDVRVFYTIYYTYE
jgi:hypothetical protein